MREIAIAIAAGSLMLSLAIALSGRWHVQAFAGGQTVRTVITDAWTRTIQVCTTVTGETLAQGRTVCLPEAQP